MKLLGWLFGASIVSAVTACGSGATNPDPGPTRPDDEFIPSEPNPDPVDIPPLNDVGVSTLAGFAAPGDYDGPRGFAFFDNPVNVLWANDHVLVADFYNGRIVKLDMSGVATTLVRQDNFDRPFGMLQLDATTLLIQTDRNSIGELNGAVWKLNMDTKELTTLKDGSGRPRSMVRMADGRIMAADYEKHFIGWLDPNTGDMTPLAGVAGEAGYADGNGATARFSEPLDMVAISATEVVLADRYNHVLRKVTVDGEVTTWAGGNESGSADGALRDARFYEPLSMARAADGTIYVADGDNFRIRKIMNDANVLTIAGNGQAGFKDDLESMNAQFRGMEGIDISPDGRFLFVADGARGEEEPFNRVRRVTVQ